MLQETRTTNRGQTAVKIWKTGLYGQSQRDPFQTVKHDNNCKPPHSTNFIRRWKMWIAEVKQPLSTKNSFRQSVVYKPTYIRFVSVFVIYMMIVS